MTPDERKAWLAERKTGLGASDIPIMLQLASWGTPWGLWADKVGLLDDNDRALDVDDDRLEFGQEIEPVLATMFERRTGLTVVGRQTFARHPDVNWAVATLDGLVIDSQRPIEHAVELGVARLWQTPEPLGGWEAKSRPGLDSWDEVGIPFDVQAQCQWQMFVTGYDRVWITVEHVGHFGGKKLGIYELERNDADIATIYAHAELFWQRVIDQRPPAVTGSRLDTDALTAAWPSPTSDAAVDLTDISDVVDEWRSMAALVKKYQEHERELGNQLRASLGTFTDGYIDGELAVSWRTQPDTRVDAKAVRKDHGRTYDKTSTTRVLRSHTPKGNR